MKIPMKLPMKLPFKFNGNIKKIVLYGLFIFYAIMIVWYYFSKLREGLDTNSDNVNVDTLKALSGNINLNNQQDSGNLVANSTEEPPVITPSIGDLGKFENNVASTVKSE